jgi:type I restriction-modification system DNA methylase subunit
LKEKLLEKHTLKAVMSMPDDLFYPIGTYPCIMVFEAHIPHDENVETFFGHWKEDGFLKTKQEGRIDRDDKWNNIKKEWLDQYKNKRSVDGKCVCKNVTGKDEWVAEAYMKTDYSNIREEDFIKEIRNYSVFKVLNGE